MRTSVVIPAYNSREALRLCLLSLTHQEVTDGSAEVIVVDDGSSDGTDEMVAEFPPGLDLRYVYEPRSARSGRARARNIGLALASGDLVVMLDSDQVVAPTFLAEHVRAHSGHTDRLVVGRRFQLGEGHTDREQMERGFSLSALPPVVRGDEREPVFEALSCGLEDMVTNWHYLWTCNVSVLRRHLAAVRGFDEEFLGWGLEDAELGYRLVRRGLGMYYSTEAAAYHEHRHAVTATMYREWLRNYAYFMRKHDDPVVGLQNVFGPAIDPNSASDPGWVDCAVRFERAARASREREHPDPAL